MGKGKRIFLAIAKFPPPPLSTRFANALCYGNTRVTRVSAPIYRPPPRRMLVQELLKNPDPVRQRDFPQPRKTAIARGRDVISTRN